MKPITRGDTRQYKFLRKDTDSYVIDIAPQKMYFTLKKSPKDAEVLIQKTIADFWQTEDYYWHFRIESEDTADLEYGKYFFDIETIQNGVVTTIKKGFVEITFEATDKGNEV